jgi:hypothetical protein
VFVVEWSECEMTEIKYKDWVVYMNWHLCILANTQRVE